MFCSTIEKKPVPKSNEYELKTEITYRYDFPDERKLQFIEYNVLYVLSIPIRPLIHYSI